MNRIFKYFLSGILFLFVFTLSVNAECSYKERKDLLNDAKGVDISVEPIKNDDNSYSFKFNITGLTDNIFIKYVNLNNGIENFIHYSDFEDGLYAFIDNNSHLIYKYKFIVYSSSDNCAGYELYSKSIKKPMYNIYSENANCKLDEYSNFQYCKKFLEKDYNLTYDKFFQELLEYDNSRIQNYKNIEDEDNVNFRVHLYIIIGLIIFVSIVIFYILYILNKKKKSELNL